LLKALREGYEYVFLLNPDTRVHPHAIQDFLRFMNSQTNIGIAGSLQIEYGDGTWSEPNEWSRLTLEHAKALGQAEQRQGDFTWVEHNYVQGAALMLRLSLVPMIGLLDPVYRTFYEETDLCRRCLLAGSRVALLLNSRVQHFGGGNWKSDTKKHLERDRLFLRNQFLYFLSGVWDLRSITWVALCLLVSQAKMILLHSEDVMLPLWRYPSVLWFAAIRFRAIRQLRLRNQLIRNGQPVPEPLWQVGNDHG
jgi:GT2 family glycosyltransferase